MPFLRCSSTTTAVVLAGAMLLAPSSVAAVQHPPPPSTPSTNHRTTAASGVRATTARKSSSKDITDVILRELITDITAAQWQDSQPYVFPLGMGHQRGHYQNNIHINVAGPYADILRQVISFPDDNGFVTAFVVDSLLQAAAYGGNISTSSSTITAGNDTATMLALNALLLAKDQNRPSTTPLFGFWPQELTNVTPPSLKASPHKSSKLQVAATVGDEHQKIPVAAAEEQQSQQDQSLPPFWQQWSINLSQMSLDGVAFDEAVKLVLQKLGLEWLYLAVFYPVQTQLEGILFEFNIPSDADDTGVLHALSRWFYDPTIAAQVPQAASLWTSQNWVESEAWSLILDKYPYCPLSTPNANRTFTDQIDTRTFTWARDFLWDVLPNLTTTSSAGAVSGVVPQDDLCLITTWVMNYDEQQSRWQNQTSGPYMPFNANNVDPTVCTNALYGISVGLLSGAATPFQEWFASSPRSRNVFLTTAKFVAWTMLNQDKHLDQTPLEMLYYPAVINLPYFVARTMRYLREESWLAVQRNATLPFPELEETLRVLKHAVEVGATDYIMHRAKKGSSCTFTQQQRSNGRLRDNNKKAENDAVEYYCWDGFLGQRDETPSGSPTPHYDDRFYTTAVAVNALLETWTMDRRVHRSDEHSLQWNPDTPFTVRDAVDGGVAWMVAALELSKRGSPKGRQHLSHRRRTAADEKREHLNEIVSTMNGATTNGVSFECTFFSGSIHNITTLPFFSPPNYIEDIANLTRYTCADAWYTNSPNFGDSTVWTVKGIMPKTEYRALVANATCAGSMLDVAPRDMGYNSIVSPWPYWSSPALTKAFGLAALVKYRAAEQLPPW